MKGKCRTSRVVLLSIVMLVTSLYAPSESPVRGAQLNSVSACPEHSRQRTPEEVLDDHIAAFVSGDAALVACDYARDAVLIQPGSVAYGKQQIQATFASFFDIAGGNIVVSGHSLTFGESAALFEYSVDSDHVVVSDGVDTFVIRHGLIEVHTAHLGGLLFK